jgi:peptidoglycan/xylan/chitin deacetylase (PgdA/CDA1 family)
MSASLVISLDFELFWGVADSRTMAGYRRNIEGEWDAIPRMLALFRRYGIHATWAAVGMLMCRDYAQWREIRPAVLPGYLREQCSTYLLERHAREFPRLFFARPLVKRILDTPGQEVATHTYSHFYCGEQGATPEQFAADLACANTIASELGLQCRSLVFPRNQVRESFVSTLAGAGIRAYRGNPDHWLYRDGHTAPAGLAGRAVRFADSWLPLTGARTASVSATAGLVNVPASLFLRPWSRRLHRLEPLRLKRMKDAMTAAARAGRLFHVWWHPHNFGVNVDQNLAVLERLLKHYVVLRDRYGMRSQSMADVAGQVEMQTC